MQNENNLNKINNENETLLGAEGQRYLIDIISYLHMKNVDKGQIEIIRADVLSMFVYAQARGEKIVDIIGDDYRTFCDEILKSTKYKKKKNIIFEWVDCVILSLLILIGITFLFSRSLGQIYRTLFQHEEYNWLWRITSGDLITWIILLVAVFIFLIWITKISLSKSGSKRSRSFMFNVALMGLCLVLAYITKTYFNNTVFYLHIGVLGMIFVIGYILHRVFDKLS